VAHQDVLHLVLLKQRVIDRQHRAAGIAEDVLHALLGKRLDHHFGAGHLLTHLQLPLAAQTSESKRAARAPDSTPPVRDGLATAGDVPTYDYKSP
jgi:hypothetical protein